MTNCPICGEVVETYHEVPFTEPYIHNIPFDGLTIYGAFSAPKQTICHKNNFFHFAFYDAGGELTQHRLVKLGVDNPTTPSPSEEYMAAIADDEEDDWSEEDWGDADSGWDFDGDEDDEFSKGSLDY